MRNIHDPGEYHAYKSTTEDSNNGGGSGGGGSGKGPGGGGSGKGPGCGGWIVIIIVAYFLIHFIFSGASWEAIDCLLGFGFLAYIIVKWLYG